MQGALTGGTIFGAVRLPPVAIPSVCSHGEITLSDSQKSCSWLSRFVRSRLVLVLSTAVIAFAVGGTAAAVATNSKATTQGPVAVKGPPLGTFTTTSGQSPVLPSAGTYSVVVRVGIASVPNTPLRGFCEVQPRDSAGDPVPGGFGDAILVPPTVAGESFSFAGMVVVDIVHAPETMTVDCVDETGAGGIVVTATDWWVAKANIR